MRKSIGWTCTLILIILNLLTACSGETASPAPPTETAVFTPTASPSPTVTPTQTLEPTPTPLPLNGQQTQYFIDATIDYYNRFITASSRAVYTNKSDIPLDELVFVVYPTIFQNAIYVKTLRWGDGSSITNFRWESHRMVIPLGAPLLPGEQIEVRHDFELYMPDREGTFGQTGRQLNLAYWFPYLPPVNDDGSWQVNEISLVNSQIVGEHLVFESADFDVTLQFTDRRENMKIAAPALPAEENGVLHYQLGLARTFTLSISDIYTLAEREVNGIKIISYAFPTEAAAGEAAADIAVDAVSLYTQRFGDLPKKLISVVEADFLHGMEFDGLILLSRGFYMFYNGTPETNLTIITPHEISHQWFFSLVGNDQALEPWLDEALATYSEAIFYEEYYPDLVPWWWENRVNGQQPTGFVDNTIYLDQGYEAYRDSVYLNGAHFIQDLRDTVGDAAFFAFLQDYILNNRYGIATGEDFWSILLENTNADLLPLAEEYFSSIPPSLQ